MIDYWLILCQLVPFTEVVLLTAIEYLREEEGGQGKEEQEGEEVTQTMGKQDIINVESIENTTESKKYQDSQYWHCSRKENQFGFNKES